LQLRDAYTMLSEEMFKPGVDNILVNVCQFKVANLAMCQLHRYFFVQAKVNNTSCKL